MMLAPIDPALKLSVVIPMFDEADGIHELLRRLVPACEKQTGDAYEIILVNDASRDGTWALIEEASQANKHIVGVNLARNHGHQLALTAGLSFARGARIFILDADLQDPPELLSGMWAAIDDGADVAYGQRLSRDGETAFKLATAKYFYRILDRLTDISIPQDTGDFRLITRRVLEALQGMPEQQRFIRGMVAWIGFKQTPVQYNRDKRYAGVTKYPLKKMVKLALDAITSFSVKPLQIAYILAFFTGIIASIVLLWTLYIYMIEDAMPGWTSLMAVILFFASIQMFVLAIFGEYLGRIYLESKSRPLFIVREVTTNQDKN